jgi:hypothetical protein
MVMIVVVIMVGTGRRPVVGVRVGSEFPGGSLQGNAALRAKLFPPHVWSVASGAQKDSSAFFRLSGSVHSFLGVGIESQSLDGLKGGGDRFLAKVGATHFGLQLGEELIHRLVRLGIFPGLGFGFVIHGAIR